MEKILACVLAIALLLTMSSCRPNEESATEKTTLQQASFTQQHFTLRNGRVIGY